MDGLMWKGKDINELSREELITALQQLHEMYFSQCQQKTNERNFLFDIIKNNGNAKCLS